MYVELNAYAWPILKNFGFLEIFQKLPSGSVMAVMRFIPVQCIMGFQKRTAWRSILNRQATRVILFSFLGFYWAAWWWWTTARRCESLWLDFDVL